jgi:ABC-type transporter Mla maintaining outer membrane lipid asymmetry permease subunit MlaE
MGPYFPAAKYRMSPNARENPPTGILNGPVKSIGNSLKYIGELRADFQHLRRWRKSVEQAQSYTFKAVITIIVTGFVGAVWLGVKVMLGK